MLKFRTAGQSCSALVPFLLLYPSEHTGLVEADKCTALIWGRDVLNNAIS